MGALTIFNKATITNPVLTGYNTSYSPQSVVVSGNYAYIVDASNDGLTILDITNHISPTLVGSLYGTGSPNYLSYAYALILDGDYAYVVSMTDDALVAIDVSTVTAPTLAGVGRDSNHLESPKDLVKSGNYIYIASYGGVSSSALSVWDVTTPNAPAYFGKYSPGGTSSRVYTIRGVAISGNYAYCVSQYGVPGAGTGNLAVIDITAPATPSLYGALSHAKLLGGRSIAISGNYAYLVSDTADCMTVIDITDPANPAYLTDFGGAGTPNYMNLPTAITIVGNYAFISCSTDDSMVIVDITTPATPTLVAARAGLPNALNGCTGVAVSGDYVYVVGTGSVSSASIPSLFPINPLLRASGVERTFWAGVGGQSVYQTVLTMGGISTTYVSPLGPREPASVITPTPLPSGPGYQVADYEAWLVRTDLNTILKIFGRFPTYQDWLSRVKELQ